MQKFRSTSSHVLPAVLSSIGTNSGSKIIGHAIRNLPSQTKIFDNKHTFNNQWMTAGAMLCAGAVAVTMQDEDSDDLIVKAECCGIVGTLGVENSYDILATGITILQNRGYDSAGIATIDKQSKLVVSKVASVDNPDGSSALDAIEEVKKSKYCHEGAMFGLAHTRWATHGGKTDLNAHPHLDHTGNIALVHNGTISNYRVLKQYLEDEGIKSVSETDSEIIVNLLGKFCKADGSNFEDAFRRTVSRLRGTWGLVCVHRHRPDVMMVSRHGSPLLIGRTKTSGIIVASEQSAFNGLVDSYVEMDENETLVLSANGTLKALESKVVHQISCDSIFLSPAPFDYWTEREIQEQPVSIQRALGNGSRIENDFTVKLGGLDSSTESLLKIKNLILLGCGTSYHASEFGACLFRKLKLFQTCRSEDASEFVPDEQFPPSGITDSYGCCMLSQSGETLDCMQVAKNLKDMGIKLFSVINVVGSALARATNLGVYINAGREVAVASTKAFMCQAVILCLISCWFHQKKFADFPEKQERAGVIRALRGLGDSVESVLGSLEDPVNQFASMIVNNRSMFILGKGLGYPVALEGALKIKEISYLHAEGFGGGSLKHGPFALLSPEERTPVILLIFDDENKDFMINAAEQVKARGSRVAIITDLPPAQFSHLCDNVWPVPNIGIITPLLAVLPMQLLSLKLALMRGYNPDKPRGLAKTVTVW